MFVSSSRRSLRGFGLLASGILLLGAVLVLFQAAPSRAAVTQLTEPFTGDNTTVGTGWTTASDPAGVVAGEPPCLTAETAGVPLPAEIPGCAAPPLDPLGEGALRLAPALPLQNGYAINETAFSTADGLVITFDLYMYGGPDGDGITLFLTDGDEDTPADVGGVGGSLGYAQRDPDVTGTPFAYVGIGFDAGGFFSAPTEGRIGGPGISPDSVVIRGAGDGLLGYVYRIGSAAPGSLDEPTATDRPAPRTARVTLTSSNLLSVEMDFGTGFETVIAGHDLGATVANDPGTPDDDAPAQTLPASLKIGFVGTNGGFIPEPPEESEYGQILEINNVVVTTATPPDLSISKTSTSASFSIPSEQTYTINVSNAAGAGATDQPITVTDSLPAELEYVSATGSTWSCSATGQDVTCDYTGGTVSAGEALAPITLTVNVRDTALPGPLANTATVTTANDADVENNTDTLTTTLFTPDAAISATKSAALAVDADSDSVISPGDTLEYTVTISNSPSAGDDATDVSFVDTIPANTTYVADSTTLNGTTVPDEAGAMPFVDGNPINADGAAAGTLPIGGSATVTFRVTINNPLPAGVDNIGNQGTVLIAGTAVADTDDPATPTVGDETLVAVAAAPNLGISQTVSPTTVNPGQTVVYSFNYNNTGNQAATGVRLTATLPAGTTFSAGGSSIGWTCSAGTCTLNVPALSAGANGSATLAVTVPATFSGATTLQNTVTISDDGSNGSDPVSGNNSATGSVTVEFKLHLPIVVR